MHKLLIAVGGSGGHLLPAQAFASDYLLKNPGAKILFAGAYLSTNRYFDRSIYAYQDITSAAPFGGIKKTAKSLFPLLKGTREAWKLLSNFNPDYVIGFGSFHAFPLLAAATLKKVPLILFESNRIPGKVSRLFSPYAQATGVYFKEAQKTLKGNCRLVHMPMKYSACQVDRAEARSYFGLDPHLPTLLIFGGSQGAEALNTFFSEQLPARAQFPFQVIHFVGKEDEVAPILERYKQAGIRSAVKAFETRMDLAYSAASLAITRSGAGTLAELLTFKVPSVMIPYPHAADGHQLANAQFLQECVRGGIYYEEKAFKEKEPVLQTVLDLIKEDSSKRKEIQTALELFAADPSRVSLNELL